MQLFNQTKNALRWSMSGVVYTAEPLGVVKPEVPDEFLYAIDSMRLPVDAAPVAKEEREPPREEAARVEKPKSKPRTE